MRVNGFETVLSRTHQRFMTNVFQRVCALMRASDVIVVLLTPGSTSTAIEYGIICGNAELSIKTIVLVPRDNSFTTFGSEGSFVLDYPKHYFYDNDADMMIKLDVAIASKREREVKAGGLDRSERPA